MKVRLAPAALGDLERLQRFLIEASPSASRRMVAMIGEAVDMLAFFPERGRPVGVAGDLRELIVPFGRSAYLLRYSWSAEGDELVVVRIRHGREAD